MSICVSDMIITILHFLKIHYFWQALIVLKNSHAESGKLLESWKTP